MLAMARLKAPVRCLGLVPMTREHAGRPAIKPGDVLTSAEGKTVEILNTDAEGRLVLGDALWYARQLGATHLVDVATLTGACVVALGKTTSGLFGTPPVWVDAVHAASERAGDRSWPMPVFDDYKEQLKSEIADFTNTGGRAGGAITGALFIKEFAGGLPWVHIDIAGTAWAEESQAVSAERRDRRRRPHAGRAGARREDLAVGRPTYQERLSNHVRGCSRTRSSWTWGRSRRRRATPASTPCWASSRWPARSCWRRPSAARSSPAESALQAARRVEPDWADAYELGL